MEKPSNCADCQFFKPSEEFNGMCLFLGIAVAKKKKPCSDGKKKAQ